MKYSNSVPPSPPLGWKSGQSGLYPSMTQPRKLEPSEAKGQSRRKYSSAPDLGLFLYLPIAGSPQAGKSACQDLTLVLLGPTWSGPWCMLVSTPKGAELRAGPGHSDWLLRGPTGNVPRCAGSQFWTGYSSRRAGPPVEAEGRAADSQRAGAGEVGTQEKGLALP